MIIPTLLLIPHLSSSLLLLILLLVVLGTEVCYHYIVAHIVIRDGILLLFLINTRKIPRPDNVQRVKNTVLCEWSYLSSWAESLTRVESSLSISIRNLPLHILYDSNIIMLLMLCETVSLCWTPRHVSLFCLCCYYRICFMS